MWVCSFHSHLLAYFAQSRSKPIIFIQHKGNVIALFVTGCENFCRWGIEVACVHDWAFKLLFKAGTSTLLHQTMLISEELMRWTGLQAAEIVENERVSLARCVRVPHVTKQTRSLVFCLCRGSYIKALIFVDDWNGLYFDIHLSKIWRSFEKKYSSCVSSFPIFIEWTKWETKIKVCPRVEPNFTCPPTLMNAFSTKIFTSQPHTTKSKGRT